VNYAVRQSVEGGALRLVIETADEGEAMAIYTIARLGARRGVYTEITRGDELVDAEISERRFTFKAVRRAPRQPSLF